MNGLRYYESLFGPPKERKPLPLGQGQAASKGTTDEKNDTDGAAWQQDLRRALHLMADSAIAASDAIDEGDAAALVMAMERARENCAKASALVEAADA